MRLKKSKALVFLSLVTVVGNTVLNVPMNVNAASENIAYGRTATSSSQESDSYSADKAVDADGNTRWASSYEDNQNLIIDLWEKQTIEGVKIAWEDAYASQYQIQVSNDNSTWTTVYENYSGTGGTESINFSAVDARYVKLYCIKRATSYGFSVYEFEVYGQDSDNVGTSAVDNNISDKKMLFLGSSVTYGYASNGVSFVDYLAKRNGCTTVKEAVSGTTLVDSGSDSYVQRMIRNLSSQTGVDHFICQLSTNDASQNKPLGTISTSYNISDFDTSTVIGAMEYIISYAKDKWDCPVSFFTGTYYDNANYQSMVDALYKLQEKWDIGIIDLWNNQEMRDVSDSDYWKYMADTVHPTAKGYLEWWTPVFEEYFRNFYAEDSNTGSNTTSTTENIAYKKSVKASSEESDENKASNAVDADGNTRWSSSYADEQNLIVDLGESQKVSSFKIAWEDAYASQYQIQVSNDNSTWTTVYEDYSAKGGTEEINILPVYARYVKIYCIKRATTYGFSVYEFEVYNGAIEASETEDTDSEQTDESTDSEGSDIVSTENIAYMKAVTASSEESAENVATYAVDADGNTRWSSSYADEQNLIVDLGSEKKVSSFKIAWEDAYASQYQIQVSNDNSTWTTVYENYNATGGTQTINISSTTARYVKIYCIKRATEYGFSIYEFEIYSENSSANTSEAAIAKQKVLDYFYDIKGSQTVVGIHNREPNSEPSKQTNEVHAITGQYPALWSGDFLFSSDDVANRWKMIYECEKQWNNGSIVQLMLHVNTPLQSETGQWDGGVCSELTDSQWNSLITDGGELNKVWKSRLDGYATYIQYLEDKGVPILFRPFHEMNQSMFWWAGRTGTNGTGALYRLTRDYLENEKGLDNIIWVWDMQDLSYDWSEYNPGNDYWDIFAVDIYNADYFTDYKYNLASSIAGDKLMAIGECDKLPTANQLKSQNRWCFVMSWSELTFSHNSNTEIQNMYWAENVIVRNELPSFK